MYLQYDFLKQFPKRMKQVGLYALLIQNSSQKQIWTRYGFLKIDEQLNVIFAVMLYIMEQSLKEEICTRDDIAAFLDTVNTDHFQKPMTFEECRLLGDFILNVVLSNEGRTMYFDGFNFEQNAYQIMNISYVANRIVYVDDEVKRTSYYLTDDGYSLLLATLEMENNMKLTIHEMIFKMHLEKQSYDKAVDEIKNVFSLLRIQLQKIQEAMGKIRRNALNYSVADYSAILEENLTTISDTKAKFQSYRELVKSRARELEEEKINVRNLTREEEENLGNLRIIEGYLNRTIEEHQKILSSHFDLKSLYTRELEQLSQMALIRRFSFRSQFYDKVLEQAGRLEHLDSFFRPLFCREPDKVYNLNKALEYQRPIRKKQEEDETEVLDFDEEAWQEEQRQKIREKLKKYEISLSYILDKAAETGEITLGRLADLAAEENAMETLVPNAAIFKEIMVELIRNRCLDMERLRQEKSQYLSEMADTFQLSEMLLELTEKSPYPVLQVEVDRLEEEKTVEIRDILDEDGKRKTVRCSDVRIRVVKEEDHGI